MIRSFLAILFLLTTVSQSLARKDVELNRIDSLIQELEIEIPDTSRILLLNKLSIEYRYSFPQKGLKYAEESIELSTKINFTSGLATALHSQGELNRAQGNYKQSIEAFLQALAIYEREIQPEGISSCLNSMGIVYDLQGNYELAIEYYHKSLVIKRRLKNKRDIAISLLNLGIGYKNIKDINKALTCYEEAMQLFEEQQHQRGIAKTLLNIGNIYYYQGNINLAIAHYKRAADLNEKMDNLHDWALSLENIGWAYGEQGDSKLAIEYAERSMEIARRSNARYVIVGNHENLMIVYQKTGDYKNALIHLKAQQMMKDTLFNEQKSKEIGRLEAKYDFEKAESERVLSEDVLLKEAARIEQRRNNLQYSGILIFIVAMAGGIFSLGKIKVSVKMAEGLIFFTFLLFFEFTLVLLDPFIESFSGGAPAYKLMFNAGLAALIFPLHSFFEEKIKNRILS